MQVHIFKNNHMVKLVVIITAFLLGCFFSFFYKDVVQHIKFIADIYMGLLQTAVIPFIFFGILKALTVQKKQAIRQKTMSRFVLYWSGSGLLIAAISVLLGVLFIGRSSGIQEGKGSAAIQYINFQESVSSLFPINILKTLSDNNILPVIILAVLLGFSTSGIKQDEMKEKIVSVCDIFIEWMQAFMNGVLFFLPLFIFISSMAMFSQIDMKYIKDLLSTVITFVACIMVTYVIIYPAVLMISRKSPLYFYKCMVDPFIVAFTSCSSVVTFPVVLKALREKYKIADSTINLLSGITLTLKHSDCLQIPIYCIFAAKIYNIPLTTVSLCLILVTGFLSGICTVGIPGGAIAVIILIFNIYGFPLEAVGLITGIYVLIDMPMTMMNVTDDAVSLLVSNIQNNKEKGE